MALRNLGFERQIELAHTPPFAPFADDRAGFKSCVVHGLTLANPTVNAITWRVIAFIQRGWQGPVIPALPGTQTGDPP